MDILTIDKFNHSIVLRYESPKKNAERIVNYFRMKIPLNNNFKIIVQSCSDFCVDEILNSTQNECKDWYDHYKKVKKQIKKINGR